MSTSTNEMKTGISLSSVPLLESSIGWNAWYQEMMVYITLAGYHDLFTRNKTRPEKGNLADDVWLARVELWEDRQERVVAAITHRLSILGIYESKSRQLFDSDRGRIPLVPEVAARHFL
jgi:hypothetical protein